MKSPRSQKQWDERIGEVFFAKRTFEVKVLGRTRIKRTIFKYSEIEVTGYGKGKSDFLADTWGTKCYVNWKDVVEEEYVCCNCPIHCQS